MAAPRNHKFAPGGARQGAGRKPKEFTAKCQALAGSPKFLKWAEQVLAGEPVETKLTMNGEVKVPVSTSDRVYLWEKLAAYGYGKPFQALLSNQSGGVLSLIVQAETETDDR